MSGNKFNAVKVRLDGYVFDSKAEAKRYGELKLLKRAGKIHSLDVHPKYALTVNGVLISTYKPDFRYSTWRLEGLVGVARQEHTHVEDVKSPPTAKKRDFILIRKLMKALHGIEVEIIGARSPAVRPAERKAA
jgi:hypothetical protein